jgi:hypothetical protein
MEAMKLYHRPHLIYNFDGTGLQLTFSSGDLKLLAVLGSKRAHGEKGETVAVVACME